MLPHEHSGFDAHHGIDWSFVEELVPDGDLILVVGKDKRLLRMSSTFLCKISPVFAAMLGPNFEEGQRLSCVKDKDSQMALELPEDDGQAVYNIFRVLYGADPATKDLEPREIQNLAIFADKYNIGPRLEFATAFWFAKYAWVDDPEETWQLTMAAFLLQQSNAFFTYTKKLVKQLQVSHLSFVEGMMDPMLGLRLCLAIEECRVHMLKHDPKPRGLCLYCFKLARLSSSMAQQDTAMSAAPDDKPESSHSQSNSVRTIVNDGDVVLVVGPEQQKIRVSADLLRQSSPVFKAMLDSNMKEGLALSLRANNAPPTEIELPADSALIVWLAYRFLYCSHPVLENISTVQMRDVAILANKYQMTERFRFPGKFWLQVPRKYKTPETRIRGLWRLLVTAYWLHLEDDFFKVSIQIVQLKMSPFMRLISLVDFDDMRNEISELRMVGMVDPVP
ncbi:hypothetical protein FZEAL_4231 [Fusarium zealandicum]|uniref:BTB domain-containing protein n=1 Tax=Fusarium zealandicum TaxID=1053134 RepID=A0A8H4XL17_9HYPO|nr:hypothetical protein FZEAL_4231 [Fusarium zealandicum]